MKQLLTLNYFLLAIALAVTAFLCITVALRQPATPTYSTQFTQVSPR